MLRSTPARIALGGGLAGLSLSVLNQISGTTADAVVDPALERAGVLASILSVLLMLIGVLWERIEPVPPDRVSLQGEEGLELCGDGLLPGLPAVLVQPLGEEGVLLLGGWSARCFGRGDQAWVEGWAQRITDALVQASDGVGTAGPDGPTSAPGCDSPPCRPD
jgi:hypothetical protein